MPINPDPCNCQQEVCLDCATDSVSVCELPDELHADGGLLVHVTNPGGGGGGGEVTQGTIPWEVESDQLPDALHADGGMLVHVTNPGGGGGGGEVTQGTTPWIVGATDLDTRDLEFATDKVDVSGSTVTVNEPVTVDGTVTVSGTVSVSEPVTVDASDLDIRNLAFATDKVDVSGSTVTVNEPVTVDGAVTVSGTVSVTEPVSVDDNGGSLTVDDGGGSLTVDGTVGVSGSVEIVNDVGNPIPVSDNGGSLTVDGTVALDAASLAALEITTVIQGTTPWNTLDQASRLEDGPHISGSTGSFVLAVRNDAGTNMVNNDLDYAPIQVDSTGAVRVTGLTGEVEVKNDSGNPVPISGTVSVTEPVSVDDNGGSLTVDGTVTTGIEKAEDAAHASGAVGGFVLAVRNDAGTSLVSDDLDYAPIQVDSTGALRTTATATVVGTVGITGEVEIKNDTGNPIPVSGTVSVTEPVSVDDNGGSLTVDASDLDIRNLVFATDKVDVSNSVVDVQQSTSPWTVEGTVDTGTEYSEDDPHGSGDLGQFILGVRNDAGAARTSTNGDYSPISTDDAGRVGISDLGGSITVDGTVTAVNTGGTLANGAQTTVSSSAVSVLASNANRKKLIIQNVGNANIRVGVTGVTATTGMRLVPDGTLLLEMPDCPTQAIFAIRESITDSTVLAQEVT